MYVTQTFFPVRVLHIYDRTDLSQKQKFSSFPHSLALQFSEVYDNRQHIIISFPFSVSNIDIKLNT